MINLFYFSLHLNSLHYFIYSILFYILSIYMYMHTWYVYPFIHALTHIYTAFLNYDLLERFKFKFEKLKIFNFHNFNSCNYLDMLFLKCSHVKICLKLLSHAMYTQNLTSLSFHIPYSYYFRKCSFVYLITDIYYFFISKLNILYNELIFSIIKIKEYYRCEKPLIAKKT